MAVRELFSGFGPAVAGMQAQRKRMEVIATNIANANTIGKDGPYVRKTVIFEEVLGSKITPINSPDSDAGGGVTVARVFEDQNSEHPRVRIPGHPFADEEGFVTRPNVNIMFEMVDLMSAKTAYQANLAVFRMVRSMVREALSNIRTS